MVFIGGIFSLVKDFFVDLWGIVNVKNYADVFAQYMRDFNAFEWILAILTILVFVALIALAIWGIVIWIRSMVLKRKARLERSALLEQIDALNRKVVKLIDEKDKIMALKVSQLGLKPGETEAAKASRPTEGRFAKLSEVDRIYAKTPFVFNEPQTYGLPELVRAFRSFAAGKLHLYYNEETVRCFVAGMATSRLLILEGISGTGKTSLPYAWGKFLLHETTIVPVQPSWRDKTELVGYFNEFTKRFNETDFLRSVYEALYRSDIGFIVLDEMNLARIEYYFASVLSILEMPDRSEWNMEIVGDTWETDPVLLRGGKIRFPANMWFVGTANQDDSTFTITDKVYDRAIPIQLNSKGKPFETDDRGPMPVSAEYLDGLFNAAKEKYPLSDELKEKFDQLDDFIIANFKLAFGNRILKQINDFVPVFVGCGGKELDGLDFMLTYKILRKLEGLNIAFVSDALKATITEIDKLFGKKAMPLAKAYLNGLIAQG